MVRRFPSSTSRIGKPSLSIASSLCACEQLPVERLPHACTRPSGASGRSKSGGPAAHTRPPGRCLTPRSSRAPTAWHAGHQALGLRPILRLLSAAPRCRCRLNSNVRHHQNHPSACPCSLSFSGSSLKTKATQSITPARALRVVLWFCKQSVPCSAPAPI